MKVNPFFRNRFDRWLKRRMPARKEIILNSGNTFIFPSKTGGHFLITGLILFLLGTNYQNNLILFLVFFMCSFMVTCLLLSFQNLAGLQLRAIDSEAQFAGQACQFMLRMMAKKNLPKDISFVFQRPSDELSTIVDGEKVVLYAFSNQRGYFNPGRVTIRSSFPFGLFNVWTHLDFDLKVLLYPAPIKNRLPLTRDSKSHCDDGVAQAISGVDQFSTLKSFQVGESLKSVAWKQLAQGRGWLSKQFEQSASGEMALDMSTLAHLPVEQRLGYLCYQIIELEKKQLRYSLSLYNQKIAMGLGDFHKTRCLQALALYEGA